MGSCTGFTHLERDKIDDLHTFTVLSPEPLNCKVALATAIIPRHGTSDISVVVAYML